MNAIFFYIGEKKPHHFHLSIARKICKEMNCTLRLIRRLPPPSLNPISEIKQLYDISKLPSADIYFIEGLQGTFYLARWFGIIDKNKKTINIIAEPLIFLEDPSNIKWWLLKNITIFKSMLKKALKENSLNIIIGNMYIETFKKEFGINNYIGMPAGIADHLYNSLKKIRPNLSSNKIVILASLLSKDRIKWKGIDLARVIMDEVVKINPNLTLEVIGEYLPEIKREYETKYFRFVGFKRNLVSSLKDYALALSLGYGDAFPVASLETMLAGIPTITSNKIGTSEIAKKASKDLIIDYFNPSDAVDKILNYFKLNLKKREKLSLKVRKVAMQYKESEIINKYIKLENLQNFLEV
jgi:glycosyltransferase involved in cell wall biosynthesis